MAKKLKGKQWYEIIAPEFFNRKVIGETLAGDPKTLNERKIGIPLTAVLTKPSLTELGINIGDEVHAYFKAHGVLVFPGEGGGSE